MKSKFLAAALLAAGPVIGYLVWPTSQPASPTSAPAQAAHAPEAPQGPAEKVELALAVEQKSVVAEFTGNGREVLRMVLMNKGNSPLCVTVPLGQVFESETAAPVVVVRAGSLEIAAGKTGEVVLPTAATRSTNKTVLTSWRLSYKTLPQLTALLRKVQDYPEMNLGTVQTAVLAITENLPLSAVAKFTLAASPVPSRFNTDAFRVDTLEILHALTVLREVGILDENLALTIDPQLKIEAMINPSARPIAMRYYGIAAEREWEFWRHELLNGEPSTRHYALYGIARFYPDVALQMLPRWARETRTNPVYRLAAVQALADTERGEALPLLRDLAKEFGNGTELARAANGAADYLSYQIAQNLAARKAVAFQHSNSANREFRNASASELAVASN